MAENSESIRTGFIRQRRNLLLSSLVLLFVETSELTIRKINVLGTELAIQNPAIISWVLVIAFLYWGWRYYVYFHDLGDKGFGSEYRDRLSFLVDRWIRKNFFTDTARKKAWIAKARKSGEQGQGVSQEVTMALAGPHEWLLSGSPGDTGLQASLTFHEIRVKYALLLRVSRGNDSYSIPHRDSGQDVITGTEALKLTTSAIAYVLIHTRIFTEYYFPFLVAAAPVVFLVYRLFGR